ncbi:myelin protein zero-like protein 3 [Engystomops pustulosus]|uniref:myelin protein zero-like protein 3 n=1 Tax=Engystomops pustulosus TaxID=76066 RepID=UPI003AFA92F1
MTHVGGRTRLGVTCSLITSCYSLVSPAGRDHRDMERRGRTWRGLLPPLLLLLLPMGFISVECVDIRMSPEVYGVVGESARLWCGFTSSDKTSELVSVDWSYRSSKGGPTFSILHYQSKAYPTPEETFKDRIKWDGDVGRGDASILLEDLRLTDNGTFSCVVRNPPDVHGNVPQTKLTVTLQSLSFKFSTVILLASLVFIPSALVSIILLIRMKRAIKRDRIRSQKLKKSPIEESRDCVYDDNETAPLHQSSLSVKQPNCLIRLCLRCVDDDDYEGDARSVA